MAKIFYFASPMCSWCWGFSPVLQKISNAFPEIKIRLLLTPFRIDTTEAMDDHLRSYVLGQWQKVHQTTGQPFDFRFAMPKGFIYNTTFACLAIKAFKKQIIKQELEYMSALQKMFYTQNKDITNEKILLESVKGYAIDTDLFYKDINSEKLLKELQEDFILCQQFAITSYPTLMLKENKQYTILAKGYASYEDVVISLERSRS